MIPGSTRRLTLLAGAALAAALLVTALPDTAEARRGRSPGEVRRLITPTDVDGSGIAFTNILIQDNTTDTFVLAKGRYTLDFPLFVFGKRDITICGATGRARDVVIEVVEPPNSFPFGIVVDHAQNIRIQDLTVEVPGEGREGIRINTVAGDTEGFADDVTIQGCSISASIGISASVRASNLTINRCNIDVSAQAAGGGRGAGIVWEDGEGLFVARTRISTSSGVQAVAGIRVKGPLDEQSDGRRARRIILARNRIQGDFEFGIDLGDVTDVRVRSNRITFSSPTQSLSSTARGRVGMRVRRLIANADAEFVELRRNRVRGALYGAFISRTGLVRLDRNDFGGCGSPTADDFYQRTGGGVLVELRSPSCGALDENGRTTVGVQITRCDFRGLRSPTSEPAIAERGGLSLVNCFRFGNVNNRTARNRPLFEGASKR